MTRTLSGTSTDGKKVKVRLKKKKKAKLEKKMLAILFHYFSYAQPYLRHGKEVQAVDYYTL